MADGEAERKRREFAARAPELRAAAAAELLSLMERATSLSADEIEVLRHIAERAGYAMNGFHIPEFAALWGGAGESYFPAAPIPAERVEVAAHFLRRRGVLRAEGDGVFVLIGELRALIPVKNRRKRSSMSPHPVRRPSFKKMNPVLAVDDVQKALSYYRDILDFEVTWTWGEPLARAGVARDGYELQLVGDKKGPTGPSVVYFHTTDVDDYYRECQQRGAVIFEELGDRRFLMRDFRVLNSSGNKLGFGEPISK